MVNRERGELEIQAGTDTYTFRLGLTAMAKLQELLSTPQKRMPLAELIGRIHELQEAKGDADLGFLMLVLLAGLQEFHSDTIRTTIDVEDKVIVKAGGLDGLYRQLTGLSESLTPDPEDQKRRAANPRKARAKTKS